MVNELAAPTQKKFNFIIITCVLSAWILYSIVASRGYITYGNGNSPDLLQSYPETDLTTLARVCVSIIVLTHFPLQAHPARTNILSLWQHVSPLSHPTAVSSRDVETTAVSPLHTQPSSSSLHMALPTEDTDTSSPLHQQDTEICSPVLLLHDPAAASSYRRTTALRYRVVTVSPSLYLGPHFITLCLNSLSILPFIILFRLCSLPLLYSWPCLCVTWAWPCPWWAAPAPSPSHTCSPAGATTA